MASNKTQDCETIQVWDTLFWSRDPQRASGYTRTIQIILKLRLLGPKGDSDTCRLATHYSNFVDTVRVTWTLWIYCGRGSTPSPLSYHFRLQNHRRHHGASLPPSDGVKRYFLANLCGFQSWDPGSQDHATFTRSLVLLGTRASHLPRFLRGFRSWRWGLESIRLRLLRGWGDLRGHFPFTPSGRIQRHPWSLLGNPSVRCHRET